MYHKIKLSSKYQFNGFFFVFAGWDAYLDKKKKKKKDRKPVNTQYIKSFIISIWHDLKYRPYGV